MSSAGANLRMRAAVAVLVAATAACSGRAPVTPPVPSSAASQSPASPSPASPSASLGYALRAAAPADHSKETAEIGIVFNVGITLHVTEPVTLVSARARSVPSGVRQLPALVGYACPRGVIPYMVEGEDLNRDPDYDVRPLPGALLHTERNGTCWYVLLRFTAMRRGAFAMSRGEVVYRVGADPATRTATFDFTTRLTVP